MLLELGLSVAVVVGALLWDTYKEIWPVRSRKGGAE